MNALAVAEARWKVWKDWLRLAQTGAKLCEESLFPCRRRTPEEGEREREGEGEGEGRQTSGRAEEKIPGPDSVELTTAAK